MFGSVIIGAKTVEQLDDNLAAADPTLSPDELEPLDEISAIAPEYSAWIFAMQRGGRVPKPFVKG